MIISHNPYVYMRRRGLELGSPGPKPRLDPSSLLVHSIPLKSTRYPVQAVAIRLDGAEPPDRNITRPWPYPSTLDE
jgi:hypothetical protein